MVKLGRREPPLGRTQPGQTPGEQGAAKQGRKTAKEPARDWWHPAGTAETGSPQEREQWGLSPREQEGAGWRGLCSLGSHQSLSWSLTWSQNLTGQDTRWGIWLQTFKTFSLPNSWAFPILKLFSLTIARSLAFAFRAFLVLLGVFTLKKGSDRPFWPPSNPIMAGLQSRKCFHFSSHKEVSCQHRWLFVQNATHACKWLGIRQVRKPKA